MQQSKSEVDKLTYRIIGAAIEVHKMVGPGLLESVYQRFMASELYLRELSFAQQFSVPVEYNGIRCEADLRCDFLAEDQVVVELKAVDAVPPVYEAQLLTYMRLLQKPKGILVNFSCVNLFKEGQLTFVNELYRGLPE